MNNSSEMLPLSGSCGDEPDFLKAMISAVDSVEVMKQKQELEKMFEGRETTFRCVESDFPPHLKED